MMNIGVYIGLRGEVLFAVDKVINGIWDYFLF